MGSFSLSHVTGDGTTDVYTSSNFNSMNIDISTTDQPMPLAQNPDTETIIMKVDGNLTKISISWKIVHETTSPFTEYSGAMTALDQIKRFKTSFFPVQVDESYTLTVGDGLDSISFEGTIQHFGFTISKTSPVVWDASLSFIHGNVVAGYDEDLPSKPIFNTVVAMGSGVVRFTGLTTEYLGNQTSMTSYKLEYRSSSGGGSWSNVTTNHTAHTSSNVNFTIGSTGSYQVRVACVTSDGRGEFSAIQTVTVT